MELIRVVATTFTLVDRNSKRTTTMGRLRPRFKSHEQSRTRRSPADLYDAALRHFLSKRHGPAEDRCRQALTLDPKHADSLHLLGLVHWQTKRPDLAVDPNAQAHARSSCCDQ